MAIRRAFVLFSVIVLLMAALPVAASTSPWCYKCRLFQNDWIGETIAICGVTTSGVGWEFCLIQVSYLCSLHTICFAGDI